MLFLGDVVFFFKVMYGYMLRLVFLDVFYWGGGNFVVVFMKKIESEYV